jgi:hypothetical protein
MTDKEYWQIDSVRLARDILDATAISRPLRR